MPPNSMPRAMASSKVVRDRPVFFTATYVIPLSKMPVRRPKYSDMMARAATMGSVDTRAEFRGYVMVKSMATLMEMAIAHRMAPYRKY
jgi:hypothetical protein